MLRPEQGYPLRLLVPGVQGVSSVKWLRRIEVGDKPWNTREESLHYIDLMPDGTHRQYTWRAGGQERDHDRRPAARCCSTRAIYEITGLAWSGRGKIRRVDVSTDGGRNWRTARLQEPVLHEGADALPHRLELGRRPCAAASRAHRRDRPRPADYRQLRAVRGTRSIYHNNAIQTWRVRAQRRGEQCPGSLRRHVLALASRSATFAVRHCARYPDRARGRAVRDRSRRWAHVAVRIRHAGDARRRSPAGTSTCGPTATAAHGRGTVAQGQDGLRRAVRELPRHVRREQSTTWPSPAGWRKT